VIPPLPEDRFLCGFSHIFAGLLDCNVYLDFSVFLLDFILPLLHSLDFYTFLWILGGYAAGYYSYKVCVKILVHLHTITAVKVEKNVAILVMLIAVQIIVS
jgi:hypothetical protein